MTASDMFREKAAAERATAAETDLPNRKALHQRAAESWEQMARRVDETARQAKVNRAAKALRVLAD